MNYADVRTALAEALRTIDDLYVHESYPVTVTPPAAVVEFPDTIDYGRTACLDAFTVAVRLFTARNSEGERRLCELASRDGVAAAVKPISGLAARQARNFGAVNVAGADLYTAEVVVELLT